MMKIKLILLIFLSIHFGDVQSQSFEDILWTTDWSPDGQYIAIGGNHGVLYLFSGQNFELLDTISIDATITNLHWHPSAQKLAILTQFSTEKTGIFDLNSKELISLKHVSPGGGRGLKWNQEGSKLAVGDNEGRVLIYTSEGDLIDSLKADPKIITALDWHPKEGLICTVGSIHSIYNSEQAELHQYKPRVESVLNLSIAWHPSGTFYVTGDYGDYDNDYKALLQWRKKSGQLIKSIEASEAEYRNIRWSPSGKYLATASEKLRIWSKDGILIKEFPSTNLLWGLDWHPDETKIITTSITGAATIWDFNGKIVHHFKTK